MAQVKGRYLGFQMKLALKMRRTRFELTMLKTRVSVQSEFGCSVKFSRMFIQGDTSGHLPAFVDIRTKVAFWVSTKMQLLS